MEREPLNVDALSWPLVLDGGLSNVLEDLGCDLNQKLWSAGILLSDPEAIVQAHLQYLRAGADIITTASYQASIEGFVSAGLTRAGAEDLLGMSVDLAIRARDVHREERPDDDRPLLVAASLGPYGAFLADGSEYTGIYDADDARIRAFHESRLALLAESGADLLAMETMPSRRELSIVAELLADVDKSAWVSFCCRDAAHLQDGTPVAEAAALFNDLSAVIAVGANCTAPAYISDLIRLFRSTAAGKRIIVYPNSGEAYHAETRTWSGISDPQDFQSMAGEWLSLGADIVGGCCRIGPEHIARVRELIRSDKEPCAGS